MWDVWLAVGVLLAVVGLGIWAIWKVKHWRDEEAEDLPLTPQQQIAHYQKMVDDGLLDAGELAQIKAQLESRPPPSPADKASPIQPPDTSTRES